MEAVKSDGQKRRVSPNKLVNNAVFTDRWDQLIARILTRKAFL